MPAALDDIRWHLLLRDSGYNDGMSPWRAEHGCSLLQALRQIVRISNYSTLCIVCWFDYTPMTAVSSRFEANGVLEIGSGG